MTTTNDDIDLSRCAFRLTNAVVNRADGLGPTIVLEVIAKVVCGHERLLGALHLF